MDRGPSGPWHLEPKSALLHARATAFPVAASLAAVSDALPSGQTRTSRGSPAASASRLQHQTPSPFSHHPREVPRSQAQRRKPILHWHQDQLLHRARQPRLPLHVHFHPGSLSLLHWKCRSRKLLLWFLVLNLSSVLPLQAARTIEQGALRGADLVTLQMPPPAGAGRLSCCCQPARGCRDYSVHAAEQARGLRASSAAN
mmetsp:Transcript_20117/g.47556  ORF Transcript_20117/g.47556 Transcript_20117/m.47556 type:complete len:200 (-) Transcript_20117:931-1530(-)